VRDLQVKSTCEFRFLNWRRCKCNAKLGGPFGRGRQFLRPPSARPGGVGVQTLLHTHSPTHNINIINNNSEATGVGPCMVWTQIVHYAKPARGRCRRPVWHTRLHCLAAHPLPCLGVMNAHARSPMLIYPLPRAATNSPSAPQEWPLRCR
jgi:hypothetical protein